MYCYGISCVSPPYSVAKCHQLMIVHQLQRRSIYYRTKHTDLGKWKEEERSLHIQKRVELEVQATRGSESEKSLWKDLERVFQSILACSVNLLHYYYTTTYLLRSIQAVSHSDGTVKAENKGDIWQLRARTNGE